MIRISNQRPSNARRTPAMGHRSPVAARAGTLPSVSVFEHVHGIPSEDELAQLVGAATPHFAFQARDRVAQYAAALPPDHPRQAELARHLERLDRLGYEGEGGRVTDPDLPPRASLTGLRPS
jgi:hypothetical protein